MAPLPKRKHSTMRKGKRLAKRKRTIQETVVCKNCSQPKISHRVCSKCGAK